MKTKVKLVIILSIAFIGFAFGFILDKTKEIKPNTDPDKNLLLGEWSKVGTPYLIKITGALEDGKLAVDYFNPKKIEIEKANWLKRGTLLSVYIELQDPDYPGSNFKLNYIPERDVLVGDYFDASEGIFYPVEFVRIR